jgi:hypothetical protein
MDEERSGSYFVQVIFHSRLGTGGKPFRGTKYPQRLSSISRDRRAAYPTRGGSNKHSAVLGPKEGVEKTVGAFGA